MYIHLNTIRPGGFTVIASGLMQQKCLNFKKIELCHGIPKWIWESQGTKSPSCLLIIGVNPARGTVISSFSIIMLMLLWNWKLWVVEGQRAYYLKVWKELKRGIVGGWAEIFFWFRGEIIEKQACLLMWLWKNEPVKTGLVEQTEDFDVLERRSRQLVADKHPGWPLILLKWLD